MEMTTENTAYAPTDTMSTPVTTNEHCRSLIYTPVPAQDEDTLQSSEKVDAQDAAQPGTLEKVCDTSLVPEIALSNAR